MPQPKNEAEIVQELDTQDNAAKMKAVDDLLGIETLEQM